MREKGKNMEAAQGEEELLDVLGCMTAEELEKAGYRHVLYRCKKCGKTKKVLVDSNGSPLVNPVICGDCFGDQGFYTPMVPA